jgi:hypothetical protein
LIQKEPNCAVYCYTRLQSEQGLLCPLFHNLNQKLVHFPLLISWIKNIWLVVLDLDSLMSCNPKVAGLPPLGTTDMTLMCISLNDVKRRAGTLPASDWTIKHMGMCLMIKSSVS